MKAKRAPTTSEACTTVCTTRLPDSRHTRTRWTRLVEGAGCFKCRSLRRNKVHLQTRPGDVQLLLAYVWSRSCLLVEEFSRRPARVLAPRPSSTYAQVPLELLELSDLVCLFVCAGPKEPLTLR